MKRLYVWYDLDFNENKIIASSQQDAKKQLLLQGKIAIKIKAVKYINKHSFTRLELLVVTKQIATMLKAGLSIVDSLLILAKEHPHPHWQYLLVEIEHQIAKGEPLSKVLTHHHLVFPTLYCEIVAIGEMTGQLDSSFEQLTLQLEKSIKLQKRIKQAMRYPCFLLTVSIIVIVIMLLVVLPRFAQIYQDFDAQLPLFTQCIIDLSHFLQRAWFVVLITLLLSYLLYRYYLKLRYRDVIDSYTLKLPIIGKVIATTCLTHIFQTIAITQQAGIPLLAGLTASANTIMHRVYQKSIFYMIAEIEKGLSFSHVLQTQPCFPTLCRQLIHIGEQSGTLDLMLTKLADYYEAQSQTLTDNLSQLVEPLLMLILALIIGSLIIAMYLPIFQLGEVIN